MKPHIRKAYKRAEIAFGVMVFTSIVTACVAGVTGHPIIALIYAVCCCFFLFGKA
ncbi:hypothetical protein [Bacillus canaveralius]|uniref:hypothetical protein n=1 Tax=Bacillus canaveralius TaxID=1403243 RepID=UPI0015E06C90|nr:hypothetical protein [Bacillus canaveralius]